jgi:ribA/ribD-fused uncharacterized protein
MIENFENEYFFLSNYFECDFVFRDLNYKSAEHAYQSMKAISKKDAEIIRSAKSPDEAKKLSRTIEIRSDWSLIKRSLMKEIVKQKFLQNPHLLSSLFDTGYEYLIEKNWWGDIYWGICNGTGENQLGKILMELRSELRQTGELKY